MGHGCMPYIGIVQDMLRKPFGQVGQPSFYINLNQGKGPHSKSPKLDDLRSHGAILRSVYAGNSAR